MYSRSRSIHVDILSVESIDVLGKRHDAHFSYEVAGNSAKKGGHKVILVTINVKVAVKLRCVSE